MRISFRLCQLAQPAHQFTSYNHATYAIGLSYAGKNSPPYVSPNSRPPRYGFLGARSKVGEWVDRALGQRAGRGVLSQSVAGGWDSEVQAEVKRWGAGEDFFCIVDKLRTEENITETISKQNLHLAISDGVGGWGDKVDPSLFSQMLMYKYAIQADANPAMAPWDQLKMAYEGLMAEEAVPAGGATACGVALGADGSLRGVNMGDSGFLIIRAGKTVFISPPLTHYFNCPYQLSKIPPSMRGQGVITDNLLDPTLHQRFSAELSPGDVVVLFTDGLSDNVPSTHIDRLLTQVDTLLSLESNGHLDYADRNDERARLFADVLVGYGRTAMTRTGYEEGWKTPFEVEARREGYEFKGGKVDDITVLTAVVGERYPEDD